MKKKVVQSLVERIPEDILKRTMVRKKKVAFKERLNTLDWVKSPGSGPLQKKMLKRKNCPMNVKNGMKTQRRAAMTKIV